MIAKGCGQALKPIVKSISSRNISNPTAKSKRSASLKPILSCKVAPATVPVDLLPPIKRTLELQRPRGEWAKEKRQSSKATFDERILSSKAKQIRTPWQAGQAAGTGKGLSREALFQRKESHLNTYFNQRKNKLKEITHENKRIYVKINSQKSLYSSRQLNKSYESSSGLSRRLSSSKLSRSSSQRSVASREGGGRKKQPVAKPKEIKIESLSINQVEDIQIHRYLNIFCNNVKIRQAPSEKASPKEPPFQFSRADKENKVVREMGKLQQIVEQFNERARRKPNLILARLL